MTSPKASTNHLQGSRQLPQRLRLTTLKGADDLPEGCKYPASGVGYPTPRAPDHHPQGTPLKPLECPKDSLKP